MRESTPVETLTDVTERLKDVSQILDRHHEKINKSEVNLTNAYQEFVVFRDEIKITVDKLERRIKRFSYRGGFDVHESVNLQ